jgi:predicted Rossmann fold nucleotide-binding protein DprA/Smf involved in DNA uptake
MVGVEGEPVAGAGSGRVSVPVKTYRLTREQIRQERMPLYRIDDRVPASLTAAGSTTVLRRRLLGVLGSVSCPEDLATMAHYVASALGRAAAAVSGFHSPVERGWLSACLAATVPVVACPARAIENMTLPSDWQAPVESGQMLLLSGLKPSIRRPEASTAALRNRLVAALADDILVINASAGGKLEALTRDAITWGKPVLTIIHPANEALIHLGAFPLRPAQAEEDLAVARLGRPHA